VSRDFIDEKVVLDPRIYLSLATVTMGSRPAVTSTLCQKYRYHAKIYVMEKEDRNNYFETPSYQAHKQQRFWQILFPVGLFSVLMLVGLVFLIVRNGQFRPGISEVGGAATVIVILPVLFIALLQLVILGALIYGLYKLKLLIPRAGLKVLEGFEKARWHIRKGADISLQPIFTINENSEKTKQVLRSLQARLFDKRKMI